MSKKGENIRKRKDGRWEGRYEKGRKNSGEIIYHSVYAKTYKEVKEKIRRVYTNPPIECNTAVYDDIRFSELLRIWLNANEMRLKGGTKAKYTNLIESQILPFLGQVRISELTPQVISSFLNMKMKNGRLDGRGGLSSSYVRSIALIISSALAYGANEEMCKPLKSPICKPPITKPELLILDRESQKRLELHLQNELTPTNVGIMISLYTGLRIGEICALSWEDIDLKSNTITVRHTVARVKSANPKNNEKSELILDTPKTKSSKRQIPIPSTLLCIIIEYKKLSNSMYVVSDNDSFVSPRTYESRYHRVLSDCNITSINYHALRHTFATRCIEAGVDVKSLSEILGHSNVGITLNTYVHSSMEMKKMQLEKLAVTI